MSLPRWNRRVYKRLLRALHKKLPPQFPVRVVREYTKEDGDLAAIDLTADNGRRYFRLSIAPFAHEDLIIDLLMHEWAHALTWDSDQSDDGHEPEWGVSYSRVYQVYKQVRDSTDEVDDSLLGR